MSFKSPATPSRRRVAQFRGTGACRNLEPECADAIIAQLARDLLALVNADTEGQVVRKVERTDA
jgi:hypothetical protein